MVRVPGFEGMPVVRRGVRRVLLFCAVAWSIVTHGKEGGGLCRLGSGQEDRQDRFGC